MEMKPTARNIERLTIRLGDAKEELKQTRKRERAMRRLLERALDAIPWYTDGRYDRLTNAIQTILHVEEPQQSSGAGPVM